MPILAVLLLFASAHAAPHRELAGIVDPFLTASEPSTPVFCTAATDSERNRLVDIKPSRERVWSCQLFCPTPVGSRSGLLVQRRWRRPVLYVDVDRDDRFAKHERYVFPRRGDLLLRLPPSPGMTVDFPVSIRLGGEEWKRSAPAGTRTLVQSWLAVYRGTVAVGGRIYRVEYPPDPDNAFAPTATNGWMGFDTNGDGRLDRDLLSPERLFARSKGALFRVGSRVVSTTADRS